MIITRKDDQGNPYWVANEGKVRITLMQKEGQKAPQISIRQKRSPKKRKEQKKSSGFIPARGPELIGTQKNIRDIIELLRFVGCSFRSRRALAEKAVGTDCAGNSYFHVKWHVRITVSRHGSINFRQYRDFHKNHRLHVGPTIPIEEIDRLIEIFEKILEIVKTKP